MPPTLTITVEIPALERLLDILESPAQAAIDALEAQVVALTAELAQHRASLQTATQQET